VAGRATSAVRERVTTARVLQAERFRHTRLLTNADMDLAEVRTHCQLDGARQRLRQAAMRQLHLSARAYHRVLKLARTIAELAGVADIRPAHLAEAIQYRPRRVDRSYTERAARAFSAILRGNSSTWAALLVSRLRGLEIPAQR